MIIKISLETKEKYIYDAFERLLKHIRFLMESREGIDLFVDSNIEFTLEIKTKE